ncbi:hypothetical protein DLAC_11695 [Tieghemostelium lacteum]|uniref:Leucine-rich repeat-containing protein (LRR) n=1 Tax=Tieghemostelium lacteum TaxID=361077 RepID=A0A151ZAE4_TIELA|nr:hypothetical protein DLAC_11695 [Tieghemostelium lacteum]|eukprot:KYQ90915.1 hypothetical protein DLAC_11695 [Tieghemostelium lacteum]
MSHKSKIKETLKSKSNRLDISACKLSELPKELKSNMEKQVLSFLELDMSFNQFKSLDFKELSSDFNSLNTLNLSGNPLLLSINFQGKDLRQLQELNLSGCKISHIDESTFQGLSSLRKLNLSNSNIDVVHDRAFYSLRVTLEELMLSGNSKLGSYGTLPSSILECKILEILDLSSCGLKSLPNGFGQELCKLLELNLGNNRLTTLPNSIGKMKRLCFLNVQDNDIQSLPLSIGHCVGLGCTGGSGNGGINLYGNPLTQDLDLKSKISQGPFIIMDYLEKKMSLHRGPISVSDEANSSYTTPPLPSHHSSPVLSSSPGPGFSIPGPYSRSPSTTPSLPDRPPSYNSLPVYVPGPKSVRDKTSDLLSQDMKKKIQLQYDQISKSKTPDEMISIGNKLTPVQEDMDKLLTTLKIVKEFTFVSPKPQPTEDKPTQIKKILNLKIEKMVLSIRHLLEYITVTLQPQSFRTTQDYDNIMSLIYDAVQKVNMKWIL